MYRNLFFLSILISFLFLTSCGAPQNDTSSRITLGAFTVPKEVYQKEIIPAFQKYWQEKTGQVVKFNTSYVASGAQSRAILAGFDADVAALSLEQDIDRLQANGLITHNWKDNPYKGIVTRSLVVIAVRPGNPKAIRDWEDLTRPGIEVIYASPKTSGGAMWVVNAIYGAGLKYSERENQQPVHVQAKALLKAIQKNVKVMDKSGRASVTTFENGVGDALVTYENEILLRQMQGKDLPYIIPDATILIENPVAIVDKNVEKHGNRVVVEAFYQFLFQEETQRMFARYGFRPVHPEVAKQFASKYRQPPLLFDIAYLGGWPHVHEFLYGAQGGWTQIMEELAYEH